jgi:hypothetical protein
MDEKSFLDLADSMEHLTRFTSEATIGVETMLLRTAKLSKDDFPAATKAVLDLSTALGGDATSQAKQFAKTLADPAKGISLLRREGIMLSDEQAKEIKTAERLGDLHKAQKLLLEDVAQAYGGAAQAAGSTFNGAMDILSQYGEQVFEMMPVTGFLPMLTVIAQGAAQLVEFLGPIAPALGLVAAGFTLVTVSLNAPCCFTAGNCRALLPQLSGQLHC